MFITDLNILETVEAANVLGGCCCYSKNDRKDDKKDKKDDKKDKYDSKNDRNGDKKDRDVESYGTTTYTINIVQTADVYI
ncbi:hypothetical protein IQ243_13255 [Nostocales cyanobacterium LEGE 11386]|nr:hypothetical protein [Nostocales cyanobacterium LEGE 11386]